MDILARSIQNMITTSLFDKDSFIKNKFFSDKTNPYYFYLPLLNHLFRLYSKDLKKPDGTPQYDVILGYGYSSIGRIKELGERMSDILTPITSQAQKVVHNAHSMGGLASLWALTKTGPNGLGGKGKAQTLITYSSPLQGIAIGLNYNSILSQLEGNISTTDMLTMNPYLDDHERSDFLKELNNGSRGFESESNICSDEKLDAYCIAGNRYANLTQKAPQIGLDVKDSTYSIDNLGIDLKNAINLKGPLNKLREVKSSSQKFYQNTNSGINIQKTFDFLNKSYWQSDQWDALSEAEENYFLKVQNPNASNKRAGRHISDGLVPLYSSTSFPKLWYPNGNTYGVYPHNKYTILNQGKKYEDMSQEERALYIDAMAQKSKSFREDRSNHTFILHLNHRTITGSDHHWDGDYKQPEIEITLDQEGLPYSVEDPQWMLYNTLQKIHAKMDEKD